MADATCAKCDEYYKDPRMLPCLHTFCLQCLEKELRMQESQDTLHCPNCKEMTGLSENGISDLPQDIHKAHEAEIARISEKVGDTNELCESCGRSDSSGKAAAFCIDCDEFLCMSCKDRHSKRRKTADHNVITAGESLKETNMHGSVFQYKLSCSLHNNQALDVYCKQCEKLVCKDCVNVQHFDHHKECNSVEEEVTKQEMERLWVCLKNKEGKIASLNASIKQCKQTMHKIETKKHECDVAINKSLDQVRKTLLAHNEEIRLHKVTALEAQVRELQRVHDGFLHASSMIKATQSRSVAQQLYVKKALEERAAVLQSQFDNCSLVPSESDCLSTVVSNSDTISKMIGLACLSGWSHAASSMCDVGYLPRAVVDKPRTIKVVAKDKEGNPFGHGQEEVEAKLILNASPESVINGDVTDHGNGSYSISLTAESTGQHKLHVTISGNHIRGSPFTFYVTNPRNTPSTALQYIATNVSPLDVAVTEEGYLAVAEYKNHTVSLYAPIGGEIYSFGAAGGTVEQLKDPSAVATRGDLLYVCEEGNGRVQKFSISKLSLISKFGTKGQGNGQLSNPRGICIDPEGNVFIADTGNNQIKVFNSDDSFAYSFDCEKHPWGVAFDQQGHLHVTTFGSDCIKVFTPEGTLLTSYGTIKNPVGIAIDAEGYINVVDNSGTLFIYSADHALINQLSNCGRGIACDVDDSLWVADSGNNCITQY